jgi:hypothetical protein
VALAVQVRDGIARPSYARRGGATTDGAAPAGLDFSGAEQK